MAGKWKGYRNYDHFFEVSQLNDFLNEIGELPLVQGGRNFNYFNIPASLDIETSSFYKDEKKYATMYLWGLCINGSSIYGRTWAELEHVILWVIDFFNISKKNRMIIYVHNLGY